MEINNYLETLKQRAAQNTKINCKSDELYFEMKEYFKDFYWIFGRYDHGDIKRAFEVCKKRGIYKVDYLVGIIKKLK